MKKFFSLIALVGVFAACQPEELTTAFQVENAQATLTVNVVCAAPGFDTSAAQVTYAPSQTIEGDPVIPEGTPITATATWNGATGSYVAKTPLVLAGATAELNGTIVLPYNAGEYVVTAEPKKEQEPPVYAWSELKTGSYNGHDAGYGHADQPQQTVTLFGQKHKVYVYENLSDYLVVNTAKYDTFSGSELDGAATVINSDFKAEVELLANGFNKGITTKTATTEYQVSAWALYNFVSCVRTTTTTYDVVATPVGNQPEIGVVGTFKVITKDAVAGKFEWAHPDHVLHYHAGTGHGHANDGNAGGGMIEAE